MLVVFFLGLIFGYVVRRSVHEQYTPPYNCPYKQGYEVRIHFQLFVQLSLSVYGPLSDRVGLPLHSIPYPSSPILLGIGAIF